MKLLRIIAALAALGVASGPFVSFARAEQPVDPAGLAAANELVGVMSGDFLNQLVTQMTNAVWPRIQSQAKSRRIDDATIAEMRKEFDRIQLATLTDVMKEAPPVYARFFTVDELHQLAAFYRTPVGEKALKVLPEVMGAFMSSVQWRLAAAQAEIDQALSRVVREHGYPD